MCTYKVLNALEQVNFMESTLISRTYKNRLCSSNTRKFYMHELTADSHILIHNDGAIHRIPVHKCLLAGSSSVFYNLFYRSDEHTTDYTIDDVSHTINPATFQIFLQIFYLPTVQINSVNVFELFNLAQRFDVRLLKVMCVYFLKTTLTIKTVFNAYSLAMKNDLVQLEMMCERKIITEVQQIFESDDLLEFNHATLKIMLLLDIHMTDRFAVFQGCIKWAKKSCETKGIDATNVRNLRTELADCFNLIRFSKMTPAQFVKCQNQYFDMFEVDEMKAILKNIAEKSNY